jgi:hypothetical protein
VKTEYVLSVVARVRVVCEKKDLKKEIQDFQDLPVGSCINGDQVQVHKLGIVKE